MESERKQQEAEEEVKRLFLDIMEGYSDSVIPPLSQFSPVRETAMNETGSSSRKRSKGKKNTESIQKERDGREKMSENYSTLQSMLPDLFTKATREKIVHQTAIYIRYLEAEIERLEGMATGKIYTSNNLNSSVSVTVAGNVTFFGIQSLVQPSLVTKIFMVFQKHGAEVLGANVAVNHGHLTVTVTASVNGNANTTVDKIKRDILSL